MQMVGERVLLESARRWHLLDGERWENEFGGAERVREVCTRRREERDVCFFSKIMYWVATLLPNT
jgi:hypothetical protein